MPIKKFRDDSNLSHKTEFIIAYAAILIGFASFRATLQDIEIYLGFGSFNIWEIGVASFSLIFLSIYLLALNSIRYGLPLLEGLKIFRYLQYLAHFFYLSGVLLPLLTFLLWLIALLLESLPIDEVRKNLNTILDIVGLIAVSIGVAGAISSTIYNITRIKKNKHEEINRRAKESILETSKSMRARNWRGSVIEASVFLELMVRERAESLDVYGFSSLHFSTLVAILTKKNILTKTQAAELHHVWEIRNLAAHSAETISQVQAAYVMRIINEVQKDLVSKSFASGYLEHMVLPTLYRLFPKHHIFPQVMIGQGLTVDFMAEGPNYTYYIEIKMAESRVLINKALEQLLSYLKENNRGLLVLPSSAIALEIEDPRIKILYFDIQNEKFSNEEEIHRWIYKENDVQAEK